MTEPPARLETSPWRAKLEKAAASRGFRVDWLQYDVGDYRLLRVEVRDRDLRVVKRAGLTKLVDRFDEASVAEGVCEWLMDPRPLTVG